ncbi:hypothetical protein JCM8097_004640 [Rhodosporidiobolus ruineniae]
MRSLSALVGLSFSLGTATAINLHNVLPRHPSVLVARDNATLLERDITSTIVTPGQNCKGGFEMSPDGQSCVCPTGKYISFPGTQCKATCASGTYKDPSGRCLACPNQDSWLRCSSPSTAAACKPGFFLADGQCGTTCPTGTWADATPTKNKCRACADQDAVSCTDSHQGSATGCLTGFLHDGLCLEADDLPANFYADPTTHTAIQCPAGVSSCTADGPLTCGKKDGQQLFLTAEGGCESSCPDGSYANPKIHACIRCDSTASTCDANGAIACGKDSKGTQLYLTASKNCILPTVGQTGFFADDATNSFKACDDGVSACIGTGAGNALQCGKTADSTPLYWTATASTATTASLRKRDDSTLVAGSCVPAEECPEASWADPVTSRCVACDDDETACTGNGAGSAKSCKTGLFLDINNDCVSAAACKASGAFYPDQDTNACAMCDDGETACSGTGLDLAEACGTDSNGNNLFLYQGNCKVATDCPGNYYADQAASQCKPCDPYVLKCTGPSQALACGVNSSNKQLYLNIDGTCVEKASCDSSTWADPATRECESCKLIDEVAETCSTPWSLSCSAKYLQDNTCVEATACREGSYGRDSDHKCALCLDFGFAVKSCDRDGAVTCWAGYLEGTGCVEQCKKGNFVDGDKCSACNALWENSSECTKEAASACADDFFLQSGECKTQCDDGFYADSNARCQPCTGLFLNSATCSASAPLTCADDYYLTSDKTSCQTDCANGEYKQNGGCVGCGGNALTCDATGVPQTCDNEHVLLVGVDGAANSCPDGCPSDLYFLNADRVCELCSEELTNALKCSDQTTITACQSGFVLDGGVCQDSQCSNTNTPQYDSDGKCKPCSDFGDGVSACTAEGVVSCSGDYALRLDSTCGSCDSGTYRVQAADEMDNHCFACPTGVATCSSATVALTCSPGYSFYKSQCLEGTCTGGTYTDGNGACQDCTDVNAATCSATAALTCKPNWVLFPDGSCGETCDGLDGYFDLDGVCTACADPNAKKCTASVSTECTTGFRLIDEIGFCTDVCPPNPTTINGKAVTATDLNPFTGTCKSCGTGAYACQNGVPASCYGEYYFDASATPACIKAEACKAKSPAAFLGSTTPSDSIPALNTCAMCPTGKYEATTGSCAVCPQANAATCTKDAALSCDSTHVLSSGTCPKSCPPGQYQDSNSVCQMCSDANARTCTADGKSLTCNGGRLLNTLTNVCTTGSACDWTPIGDAPAFYQSGSACYPCKAGEYTCAYNRTTRTAPATACYQVEGSAPVYLRDGACITGEACIAKFGSTAWFETKTNSKGVTTYQCSSCSTRKTLSSDRATCT